LEKKKKEKERVIVVIVIDRNFLYGYYRRTYGGLEKFIER
jgi:hypothetical protein